jgi:Recombination enhancement, RecA-dependent nuclease
MKAPTKSDKARFDRIVQDGCLVCRRPATIHHVTASIHGGRLTRRHDRVVPLCPMHHQAVFDPFANDPVSVERLSHRGFYLRHGIDLLAEAERLADG